jgi:prevent-host-death family protein
MERAVPASWKLEDAKARFSEVVRKAQTEGIQRVTVRGREAVAVISVDELARLVNAQPQAPLIEFLEGLHLHELDLERASDTGRDVEL